jgi:hypothetical protein
VAKRTLVKDLGQVRTSGRGPVSCPRSAPYENPTGSRLPLERVWGVDSFQALLLGVAILRLSLKQSRRRFVWSWLVFSFDGGSLQQIAVDLGEQLHKQVERLLNYGHFKAGGSAQT